MGKNNKVKWLQLKIVQIAQLQSFEEIHVECALLKSFEETFVEGDSVVWNEKESFIWFFKFYYLFLLQVYSNICLKGNLH